MNEYKIPLKSGNVLEMRFEGKFSLEDLIAVEEILRNLSSKARQFPLGFSSANVPPHDTKEFVIKIEHPEVSAFLGRRLIIPSDVAPSFSLVECRVGEKSIFPRGPISAKFFTELGVGTDLLMPLLTKKDQLTLIVKNETDVPVMFCGVIIGEVE